MFSNQALRKLIIPLFMDQILIITVGIIARMMLSYASEAAVSGVSLLDMINMIYMRNKLINIEKTVEELCQVSSFEYAVFGGAFPIIIKSVNKYI